MPSSSRLTNYLIALLSLTATTVLLAAGSASAAAPDAPWSASGTGVITVGSDGTVREPAFTYGVYDAPTGAWMFSATARAARVQPIQWRYRGHHVTRIEKFVIRGGKEVVKDTLASNFPGPAGPFDYTGSTTFDLQPGDVYGFRMAGSSEVEMKLTGELRLQIPDATPPTITPTTTGTLGKNGFYTSDVKVAWKVEDPEDPYGPRTGCGDVSVTADTAGRTFTCTAESHGGKASQSVTIKRDATAPELTVPATIVREGAGQDGLAVGYAASATDTIDASPRLDCSPPSGTRFAIGTTRVACTASDAAGHSVAKDFEVIVLRGADPVPTPTPDLTPAPDATPTPVAAPSVTDVHVPGPVTIVQAPPVSKQINPVLAFRFTVTRRITRLKQLTVKNLPPGSTVTITCAGGSCPKALRGRTVARRIAKTSLSISSLVNGPLKAGTVITVVITSPDAVTATKKLTVRKGKAPQVTSK